MKLLGRVTAVLLVVILVLGGVVTVIYVNDQSVVSSQSSAISQQSQTILGQVATIQSQSSNLVKDQSSLTKLEANITATQAILATLQAEFTPLQAQVKSLTSIVGLGQSKMFLSQQLVPVPSLGDQVASTFVANYSGYVTVTMTQISDINNVQVGVLILFGSSVNSGQYTSEPIGPYAFTSVPGTLVFPVTPGSITVYLSNADSSPGNATLSINYYY